MSERTTSLFSEAAAAESRQDFDHAARLYEAILFEDPIELRARVRLAGVELARGRHAAAAQLHNCGPMCRNYPTTRHLR